MTITSSPPMRTSPTVTTVLSGLKVRLASLYGSEMRTHLVHAVEHLDQPGIGPPLSDRAEHRPGHAGRPMDVHAHLHETRDDLLDLRFASPVLPLPQP